jgi:hypothetical protein
MNLTETFGVKPNLIIAGTYIYVWNYVSMLTSGSYLQFHLASYHICHYKNMNLTQTFGVKPNLIIAGTYIYVWNYVSMLTSGSYLQFHLAS